MATQAAMTKSLIGMCAAYPAARVEREALAQRVADAVTGAFTKLATAKDDIDALAVQYMLNGRESQAKPHEQSSPIEPVSALAERQTAEYPTS